MFEKRSLNWNTLLTLEIPVNPWVTRPVKVGLRYFERCNGLQWNNLARGKVHDHSDLQHLYKACITLPVELCWILTQASECRVFQILKGKYLLLFLHSIIVVFIFNFCGGGRAGFYKHFVTEASDLLIRNISLFKRMCFLFHMRLLAFVMLEAGDL